MAVISITPLKFWCRSLVLVKMLITSIDLSPLISLSVYTHTADQFQPGSNWSLSLSITAIRVWAADTLWPLNMWTLHHVNRYRILWWADSLESIQAERIPVQQQQHTAESGQVMLPQANRQVNLLGKTYLSTKQQCALLSFTVWLLNPVLVIAVGNKPFCCNQVI